MPLAAHGPSRMTCLFIATLAAAVVVIGLSREAGAADARGRCHQRCVDVFLDCTNQVGSGSAAACQRELNACQRTCR